MKNFTLKRDSKYRNVFEPNITYYYEIDYNNIHNDILYSHKVYCDRVGQTKKAYLMAFTKRNFNRCFTNIQEERKLKIQKLTKIKN